MIDSKAPLFASISIHAGYSLFCRGFRRVSGRFSEEKGRRDANAAGSSRREGGLRVDHGMIVRQGVVITCKVGGNYFALWFEWLGGLPGWTPDLTAGAFGSGRAPRETVSGEGWREVEARWGVRDRIRGRSPQSDR